MTTKVVVLGAGYAGTRAALELEKSRLDLTWISMHPYHLVLHESHRLIKDPDAKDKITIPVDDIKSSDTEFVEAEVTGVDAEAREVELADGDTVDYDYLLVALGSNTAFYGIPGLRENALTLKSLDDAVAIHEAVAEAAAEASADDPARVVVGGAGLSGIQSAGEVAEYRDHHDADIEIVLVEALEEILPGHSPELQKKLRGKLEDRGVEIMTDDPITEADESTIYFEENGDLQYNVFIWTGGITGRKALEDCGVEKEHNRLNASSTFETSDPRVFAIGDSAVVEQDGQPAPPTAQAAWQAAEVAARNIERAIQGEELERWRYDDKGTLISVGEDAVAHDVVGIPIETFGGYPAVFLKKFIGARWIASVTGWRRALKAWKVL